jgi:catechol 2,3-dioxygenase-like lactoylglutathione lyase family enzyme
MAARSQALTHVAMSVPPGTLTDDYRQAVLDFYGDILGWREIDQLRLPDRMTIAIGRACYVNLRERDDDGATYGGYDHFGVAVDTEDELRTLWADLHERHPEVELREIGQVGSVLTFKMQHLLPLAIEVQYFGRPAEG